MKIEPPAIITRCGILLARPEAFLFVVTYGVLWRYLEPETFDWHAVATLVTLILALFIVRSEHRDTQAIHAKLDELLRADAKARSELALIDQDEPEEIEDRRKQQQA